MKEILKYYEDKFNYLGSNSEKYDSLVTSLLKKHNYCINEDLILELKKNYNNYITDIISSGVFNYILNEYLFENYDGTNLFEVINNFFETINYFPNSEGSINIIRKSADLQKLFNYYTLETDINCPFLTLYNAFTRLSKEEPRLIKKSIRKKQPLFVERRDMFERIKNGDIEARNEFFMQNMGLVNKFTLEVTSDKNLLDDYRQVGYLALINAISCFDYTKGIKFSTYAAKAIYNSFSQYDRQMSYSFHVPENIHILIRKYSYLLWNYEVTETDLDDNLACSLLNINLNTLNLLKKNYNAISLYEKPSLKYYSYLTDSTDESYLPIVDLTPDDNNFLENLEQKLVYLEVDKLIASSDITGKKRACFFDYFGFENDTGIDPKTIPRSSYYYYRDQALKSFCTKDNIENLSNMLDKDPNKNIKIYCKQK